MDSAHVVRLFVRSRMVMTATSRKFCDDDPHGEQTYCRLNIRPVRNRKLLVGLREKYIEPQSG